MNMLFNPDSTRRPTTCPSVSWHVSRRLPARDIYIISHRNKRN